MTKAPDDFRKPLHFFVFIFYNWPEFLCKVQQLYVLHLPLKLSAVHYNHVHWVCGHRWLKPGLYGEVTFRMYLLRRNVFWKSVSLKLFSFPCVNLIPYKIDFTSLGNGLLGNSSYIYIPKAGSYSTIKPGTKNSLYFFASHKLLASRGMFACMD